eukprot:TRINITY_DN4691_c0_g1_i2.p2 TRINITY_DN4691_c0_g1~~TRINITY_DN4691_c0_g1_i2.p2  ORF type:complete len:139 (+),score=35.39 TRINITY_DN4691_c0_g1_i2:143-559(+)
MAFRFNFANDEDEAEPALAPQPPAEAVIPAQEVSIETGATDVNFTPHVLAEKVLLFRGNVQPVDGALAEATSTSDLVPRVYEGGFKLWECAVDLCEYMIEQMRCDEAGVLKGQHVIELGCGHGLPAILALKAGMPPMH